ncbi:hypothetical protein B0T10DRAFT_554482 [Thelonectria olida]|uniref:NmrA-like domain-containing protein n=1 Tax=Thelonectria olida TaxID=1576542 RepID=A0A9P9AWM9_9HYPO|nr:hypothetical protein B0T10DRAFT_554482 [Thelonectria olida]
MRIAIAGGGGLGYLIAKALSEAPTAYSVVVLSRFARTDYAALDIQVLIADYNDPASLGFSLQGVNLVISVVQGAEQLTLITAAANAGVQLFVPSEFEGKLNKRPSRNDPLDAGGYAAQARALLRRYAEGGGMQYTVFSCGIFMERFHPSGLAAFGMGESSGLSDPGMYLLDLTNTAAEIVERNEKGHSVRICMTSVYDVAQFIVAAIQLNPGTWGREWTMKGDKMSLQDLVGTCGRFFNTTFQIQYRQVAQLPPWIAHYQQQGDYESAAQYQRLLSTAEGRYEFNTATLNDAIRESPFVDVRPTRFREWLESVYPPET